MNKNSWLIIGLLVLIIGIIVWVYYLFKEDRYNWYESFNTYSDQPFGTQLTIPFIKQLYPDQNFIVPDSTISKTLKERTDTTLSNYVYIGAYFAADSAAWSAMYDYVASGNNVFMFVQEPDEELIDNLHIGECLYYTTEFQSNLDTVWKVGFTHPDLQDPESYSFKAVNRRGPITRSWNYFPVDFFCDYNESITTLGTANDYYVNFARFDYGAGHFYIHTNPILFTNYFLVDEQGADYARKVLSHFLDGDILYEDYIWQSYLGGGGFGRGRVNRDEGPFKYLMSQESLRWAVWVALGLLIVYVFFGMKRKQRIIPVLPKPENSSIEYVETISELFYQSEGRNKVADYLFDQYYEFVKHNYNLTPHIEKEKFLKRLVLKSEIAEKDIEYLDYLDRDRVEKNDISSDDIILYYKNLEKFYANCK